MIVSFLFFFLSSGKEMLIFFHDVCNVLQVLIWIAFPNLGRAEFMKTKHAIRLVIILQFLLRLYLTIPLSTRIIQATGNIMEKGWAGAAFNLGLFMLASHVSCLSDCSSSLPFFLDRENIRNLLLSSDSNHTLQAGICLKKNMSL